LLVVGCAAAIAIGCSSGQSDNCSALVQQYYQEKDDALVCDPTSPDPCGGQFPVVVVLQQPDGTLVPQALASDCTHATNPARSAKLQDILQRFQSQGCTTMNTPGCGALVSQCAQQADGGFSCAP
jgi:hypothetical protein